MRFSRTGSIGLCLIGTIAIGITSVAFAAPLSDIEHNANKLAITALAARGIINGYADGTFKPDKTMNRAEFTKVLVTSVGIIPSLYMYHDCFSDVTTEWFAPSICYAKEQGWVQGYSPTLFKPENTVSKPEAIKMIVSADGFVPTASVATTTYTDVVPGSWYVSYVAAAKAAGILPTTSGNLGIHKLMTRGAVIGLVYASMQARVAGDVVHLAADKNTLTRWDAIVAAHRRGGSGGGSDATSSTNSSAGEGDADELLDPTIHFDDIVKNFGDALTLAATSDSNGTFSYVIDDTSIATVSGNVVTLRGSGSTIITVTQAADGDYQGGTAQATLTVHPIAPTITFDDVSTDYGTDATLTATSDSNGAIAYVSNNTGIATVSTNILSPAGVGTTTVTATQSASGGYTSGSKTMTLTVHIGTPAITFNDFLKFDTNSPFSVPLTTNSDGAVTYTSSDIHTATVSGHTITIVAAGPTTITAHQAATVHFTGAVVTALLTVLATDKCAAFPCGINGTCTRTASRTDITPAPLDGYSCSCNVGYGGANCQYVLVAPTVGVFTGATKQMGDLPFVLRAPTSDSDGQFTYASSNTHIVTISGSTVTIIPDDTIMTSTGVTITATQAASGTYLSATKTMTLTVAPGECSTEPCINGGTCTDMPSDTYLCACPDHYSGTMCELDDFNCYSDGPNFCLNGGTCVPSGSHGECSCIYPFSGSQCQVIDNASAFLFDPYRIMCSLHLAFGYRCEI